MTGLLYAAIEGAHQPKGKQTMLDRTTLMRPSLVVMMLAGIAGFTGVPSAMAQTTSTAAPTDKAAQRPIENADKQIAAMHAKLKITAAQDPQWEAYVKAQRDAAEQMSELIAKREATASSSNAVDDFKAYAKIAQAHADGLKNVIPAFEALYGVLSDDQKKIADTMLDRARGERHSK
jgi:hypothetical protein